MLLSAYLFLVPSMFFLAFQPARALNNLDDLYEGDER
jgi:hypothetical protein